MTLSAPGHAQGMKEMRNSLHINFSMRSRWSISIGVSLFLNTDGDMSQSHLCRNLN